MVRAYGISSASQSLAQHPQPHLTEDEEDESEGVIPSGEVMPMPGGWLACALAAATLASSMIADKMHLPRIKFGLSCSILVGNRQR